MSEKRLDFDVDTIIHEKRNDSIISNKNVINNIVDENNINFPNKQEEKEDNSENNYENFYENYSELSIDKKAYTKYIFVNQSWYVVNKDKLFSSQIINIIYTNSNLYKENKENSLNEKEEQLMLSAELIDNANEEEIYDINQQPIDTNVDKNLNLKKKDSKFYDENKGIISRISKKKKKNKTKKKK